MTVVARWLVLDLRRRWRSLLVLGLLIGLAGGLVMAAFASARRAASTLTRLRSDTLPATVAVLPNQNGFDWTPIEHLPYVAAVAPFVVDYAYHIDGIDGDALGFPFVGPAITQTVERPIVFAGRVFDVTAPDEAMVSRRFAAVYHKGVGDTLTLHLPSPEQISQGVAGQTPDHFDGPTVTVHIVGVGESPWFLDGPDSPDGGIQLSPGLTAAYPENILGDQTDQNDPNFVNALIRLDGGEADIPRLRTDIARISGRSDIDIWDLDEQARDWQRQVAFEAQCLAAFGIAAFIAALFLLGQSVVRYAAASSAELQNLRALGLSPRQSVGGAAAAPIVTGAGGALLAVLVAWVTSIWTPIGTAHLAEPSPGLSWDWVVLGPGFAVVVLLVGLAAVAGAALALGASRREPSSRRSAVAILVARTGAAVPLVVGARFALEPGRGRTAVPVRPALVGAVAGVLGVVGVFTFGAGITDATSHPERYGQTFDTDAFVGINGQDFGPVEALISLLNKDSAVAGVDNARTAVATGPDGNTSVALWEYSDGRSVPVTMLSGRMAQAPGEVVLAPRTLAAMGAQVGQTVQLTGSKGTRSLTVTGEGLVVEGPHNSYADGGWITTAGYDTLFTGFKYHLVLVALRPEARHADGTDGADGAAALAKRVAAAGPDLAGFEFDPPTPPEEITHLLQVRALPMALGIFLVLLALGTVGHALATAVRRRSHDLAVLRAAGMTRWQCRWVVVTQATVLAVVGLLFGVPVGLAVGRTVWRVVATDTPVQYVPPVAVWAMLLVGPAALLAANVLAGWPSRRAARLRVAQILRAE